MGTVPQLLSCRYVLSGLENLKMASWESLMAIILQINPFCSDASLMRHKEMRTVKTRVCHLRI